MQQLGTLTISLGFYCVFLARLALTDPSLRLTDEMEMIYSKTSALLIFVGKL